MKFTYNNTDYYCVLAREVSGGYEIQYLNATIPASAPGNVLAQKTKNPPYEKDHYDNWGFYKSDYKEMDGENDNVKRITTKVSAQNTDVWSLRRVETSLGATIDIDYESDTYWYSVLNRNQSLVIDSFTDYDDVEGKVRINIQTNGLDLRGVYEVGQKVDMIVLIEEDPGGYPAINTGKRPAIQPTITEVGTDYLRIQNKELCEEHLYLMEVIGYDSDDRPIYYTRDPIGGNIALNSTIKNYGGGIRVKSISTTEPVSNIRYSTQYNYQRPNSNLSSGITSYEPVGLDKHGTYGLSQDDLKFFKKELYKSFSDLLANARELPAPGVHYAYVTVSETVKHPGEANARMLPGSSRHHFQTFKEGMVGIDYGDIASTASSGTYSDLDYDKIETRQITLKDYSTQLGHLKSVAFFDAQGNKRSETIQHYLHDDLEARMTADPNLDSYFDANANLYETDLASRYNNQGLVEESFKDGRMIKHEDDSDYDLLAIVSRRESFPAVQTGTTHIDYKTGMTTKVKNLEFDFYSGAPTKVLSSDHKGNHYVTVSEPAYQVKNGSQTAYPDLGLKVANMNNKHMLSQGAASYTYKVNGNYKVNPVDANILGVLSAAAQTWSNQVPVEEGNQSDIWRKHRNFFWIGDEHLQEDGTYAYSALQAQAFDAWAHSSQPTGSFWQQDAETTLYDVYSHALEGKDINGEYISSKMDNNYHYVLATAANASYNELAYSGAEEDDVNGAFGGNVQKGDGSISNQSHTGTSSLSVGENEKTFIYNTGALSESRSYLASAWTMDPDGMIQYQAGSGNVQTVQASAAKKAGDWYLITAVIQGQGGQPIEVWCTGTGNSDCYYDDFRLHPIEVSMTSYVYNFWGELTHILDANNLYTRYEYDDYGRLKATYRESFQYGDKKVSASTYNYAR